jgi:hypothetical protein
MTEAPDGSKQLVREVNDRIYEVLQKLGSEDGDFLCECGEEECAETVQITLREYAAIQAGTNQARLRSAGHPAELL